jgi:hypothetical protein
VLCGQGKKTMMRKSETKITLTNLESGMVAKQQKDEGSVVFVFLPCTSSRACELASNCSCTKYHTADRYKTT